MRKFEYKKITIFGSETMPLEEAGAEGWLVASVHVENMASVYTMVREVAAPVETAQYSPEMAESSRIKKMLRHNQHIEIADVAAEHFFEKMEGTKVIWEDDIAKYVKEELLADFVYPDWILEKVVAETMAKLIAGSTLGAKQKTRKTSLSKSSAQSTILTPEQSRVPNCRGCLKMNTVSSVGTTSTKSYASSWSMSACSTMITSTYTSR